MDFLIQEWKWLAWRRWVVMYLVFTVVAAARMYSEFLCWVAVICSIVAVSTYLVIRYCISRGYTIEEVLVGILQVYSWPFHGYAELRADADSDDYEQDAWSDPELAIMSAAISDLVSLVRYTTPTRLDDDCKIWRCQSHELIVRQYGADEYDCAILSMICGVKEDVLLGARTLMRIVYMDGFPVVYASWDMTFNRETLLLYPDATRQQLPGSDQFGSLPAVCGTEMEMYGRALQKCVQQVAHEERTR